MRHHIVPASYLIFEKEGKILLIRRFQTGYCDGQYSLVAGHVDPGETFVEAAVREAQEEAGVNINPENLEMVYLLHRDSQSTEDNERVDVFFVVRAWDGELQNMEPHKCDEFSWHTWEDLPVDTIPYIRFVLGEIREKKIYGEFGWRVA